MGIDKLYEKIKTTMPEGLDEIMWVYSKKERKMMELSHKEMKYFIENDKLKLVPGKQPEVLEHMMDIVNNEKDTEKPKMDIKEMVL